MNIFLKNQKQKTVIIICGPTAAGKSSIAIRLAKHFHTEIISADSRQCFKELNIGVARPSETELGEVKHHFIASHSIHDELTAAGFEQYALQKTADLFQEHDVIIMVGGTGLYLKAFCEGMDKVPEVNKAIRESLTAAYSEKGTAWLQEELKKKDPEFYSAGEIQNPQRMIRALEVMEATGRSILHFHKKQKVRRDFNIIKIGLELPKEELHRNINTRVDKMMEAGLMDEVKSLSAYRGLNALQTVGYTEIFDCLDRKITLQQATEEIKKNTRQYAKRQVTWFRKDGEIKWFSPAGVNSIIEFISPNFKYP